MEEGQRLMADLVNLSSEEFVVLILVVMEEGQRPDSTKSSRQTLRSLNPCCNGRGSKTSLSSLCMKVFPVPVLILVVMEEGQRLGSFNTELAEAVAS